MYMHVEADVCGRVSLSIDVGIGRSVGRWRLLCAYDITTTLRENAPSL